MGEFDEATSVTQVGDSRYAGSIDRAWDIAGNANGGYLMAIAGRAMAHATGRPPLSLTAHYLAPGRPGPCWVDVTVLRAGRQTATASASLRSADGSTLLALIGTFGAAPAGALRNITSAAPVLPPPDECVRAGPPVDGFGFRDRVDTRLRPADVAYRDGAPSGRAEMVGWFEFVDRAPVDVFGLLLVTDAFAPVVFNLPGVAPGWAPTLELTVHVRGTPAPGPLRCRFTSAVVQDGMFEEDGEVWDSSGAIVAMSRQLALVPRGS